MNSTMHVEIWSDVMCPFCYIGKHRFEEALRQFDHKSKITVLWKSFQLDPSISGTQNKGYAEVLATKKGMSLDHVQQMFAHVAAMGASSGVQLYFEKAIVANSHKAHQILHLAHSQGLQNAMKESLLKAHFTDGKDLEDAETLVALGSEVGLGAEEIRAVLRENTFADAVSEDIHEAEHLGIQGVPFFVFDRKYAVSGAQEVSVFAEVLRQSFEEWEQENAQNLINTHQNQVIPADTLQGEVCQPGEICT